jgi:hypothetical protein
MPTHGQNEELMKTNNAFAPVAALGLLLSTTALYAQTINTETRSVSASVSGALMGDTGFLTGGQVQVGGVGQGSVTLARNNADINIIAGSRAQIPVAQISPIPQSESSMITTMDFNRDVNTSGALVGIGTMIAQGESMGGVAVVGSANANATRAGTGTSGGSSPTPTSGSSTTPTSAQGSLVGNFSTANTMQLLGTGALFAGSQALNVGERNVGVSAGRTGSVAANASDIDLTTLTFAATPSAGTSFAPTNVTGNGAGFATRSTLNNGTTPSNGTIAMNVSNAGNGSVMVNASTGGFFGQGTTFGATAAPTFSNIGFFTSGSVPAAN